MSSTVSNETKRAVPEFPFQGQLLMKVQVLFWLEACSRSVISRMRVCRWGLFVSLLCMP